MKTNMICLAALLAFTAAPALAQTTDGTGAKPTASATKGAVAGGVAGHMMGGHTKTGAVAGAMVGHHMRKKQMAKSASPS